MRSILLLVSMLCLAPFASASAQLDAPRAQGTTGPVLEARVRELVSRLSLSPEQTMQVRQVLMEAQAALDASFGEGGHGASPAARDARQRILWEAEDRIWALLRCEQKDAFRLMERARRVAQLERRGDARRGPQHPRGDGHRRRGEPARPR